MEGNKIQGQEESRQNTWTAGTWHLQLHIRTKDFIPGARVCCCKVRCVPCGSCGPQQRECDTVTLSALSEGVCNRVAHSRGWVHLLSVLELDLHRLSLLCHHPVCLGYPTSLYSAVQFFRLCVPRTMFPMVLIFKLQLGISNAQVEGPVVPAAIPQQQLLNAAQSHHRHTPTVTPLRPPRHRPCPQLLASLASVRGTLGLARRAEVEAPQTTV